MKKIIILMLPLFVFSGVSSADEMSKQSYRAEKWEFGLLLNYVDSWDVTGANATTINVDSDTGWGISAAYNFNEHLNLGFDFTYNSQPYSAVIVPSDSSGNPTGAPFTVNNTLDNDAVNFNLTYNFMAKTITPYVTGTFGWTYLNSNIQSSQVSTGCWWDPWWGYVCAPYYSTYNTTPFSYGVGLGVRWEVANNIVLKASVDRKWLDVSKASGDVNMDVGKITLSWMIR